MNQSIAGTIPHGTKGQLTPPVGVKMIGGYLRTAGRKAFANNCETNWGFWLK